jgi:hypothetical protein
VFCSYGNVPCPPIQAGGGCCAPAASAQQRDWLADPRVNAVAWWLPVGAIIASLLAPLPFHIGTWTVALAWMGTACILNLRRCGRTHCRYTGPYYLADRSRVRAWRSPRYVAAARVGSDRRGYPARQWGRLVGYGTRLWQVLYLSSLAWASPSQSSLAFDGRSILRDRRTAEPWHRRRGDGAHCRADDRRHGVVNLADEDRDPGELCGGQRDRDQIAAFGPCSRAFVTRDFRCSAQSFGTRRCNLRIADGKTRDFQERNLRFKTDVSDDGPQKGAPAIVPTEIDGRSRRRDRRIPRRGRGFISHQC